MITLEELLRLMVEKGGSDLHISAGSGPRIRVDGALMEVPNLEPMLPEQTKKLIYSVLDGQQIARFEQDLELDMSFGLAGVGRFRVNVFFQRGAVGSVLRTIPYEIFNFEQLGVPRDVCTKLCELGKGLVLVTGATGSGKSTTLAAMIDHINTNKAAHIITIEDPVEFVHPAKKCLINQREVHAHTKSFSAALRAALREDPDIVLVGEMRDLETTRIAIETAETGHLVFGTLHTSTASSTVDRIINQFPAEEQEQIRLMLAGSLKGVVAQNLLKKKGGGRVAALEILIVTPGIAANIRDGKTYQIPSAMQIGTKYGMQLLNDALERHVKNDVVDAHEAYDRAMDKEDMAKRLKALGHNVEDEMLAPPAPGGAAAGGAAPAGQPAKPPQPAPGSKR